MWITSGPGEYTHKPGAAFSVTVDLTAECYIVPTEGKHDIWIQAGYLERLGPDNYRRHYSQYFRVPVEVRFQRSN